MLKSIISLALLCVLNSAFAKSVTIIPNKPVDCHTYSGPLEIVHNAKITKDNGKVTVSFFGAFGKCEDQKRIYTPLKRYVKLNVWNEGINGPWNYFRGEVNVEKMKPNAKGKSYVFLAEITLDEQYLEEHSTLTFTMKQADTEIKSLPTLLSWRVNFLTNNVTPIQEGN